MSMPENLKLNKVIYKHYRPTVLRKMIVHPKSLPFTHLHVIPFMMINAEQIF